MSDERRKYQNLQIEQTIRELQGGINVDQNFRCIFDLYYYPLHRFFQRKLFSPEDAHELTQETFLRIYNKIEQFRGDAPFEAWLWQIAANLFRKRIAERHTHKRAGETFSLDDEMAAGEEFLTIANQTTPIEAVLEAEQRELLLKAIAELPEQMRKCMLLRAFQDLSYQEIAVVLKISVQTVKAHLFQGRQRLRDQLGAYFEKVEL